MHHLVNELRPVQVGFSRLTRRSPSPKLTSPSLPCTLYLPLAAPSLDLLILYYPSTTIQARETLKTMMRAQIDQRRAKTVAIKQ